MKLPQLLAHLQACPPGRDWAATQPDAKTAWHACTKAQWLIWAADVLDLPLAVRVSAVNACLVRLSTTTRDLANTPAVTDALRVFASACSLTKEHCDDVRQAQAGLSRVYDRSTVAMDHALECVHHGLKTGKPMRFCWALEDAGTALATTGSNRIDFQHRVKEAEQELADIVRQYISWEQIQAALPEEARHAA